MGEAGKQKDFWDKLDIFGKLTSGVVLAIIAAVIKFGADDIAASQHRGELVRSLIADLTTRDQQTRQDLALIALHHSVGAQNPALVREIAERLVVDTTGYSKDRAAGQALSSVAFRILQEVAPERADSLRAALQRQFELQVSSDSLVRAAARSAADTTFRPTATPVATAGDSVAKAASAIIAPVLSRVVFIQFQGSVQRQVMDSLRMRFSRTGFAAPGVERIATPFTSAVRYFHVEDASLADSAAAIARAFVQERGINVPAVPIENFAPRRMRVPRGQIEVWLSVR